MDILSESNINGIVVFRYVAIDVIKASVADLDVDLAIEYQLEEAHKGGYTLFRGLVGAAHKIGK